MKAAALHAVWKRKFALTTDSRHNLPIAENLLKREFEVAATGSCPGDRTLPMCALRQGWLYLAAVMDLFSRKIIG